jgi:Protein of unknown function (DUF3352)
VSSSTEGNADPQVPADQDEDERPPRLTASRHKARLLAAAVALAAVAVVIAVAAGQGEAPPATGASTVVPADALLYVNVSIDSGRPAVRRALALARRFPSYPLATAALLTRLSALLGGNPSVQFARDVRPWLGNELAVAFLDTSGSSAGSLVVLDVSDSARAHGFLERSGATSGGSYRDVPLVRYSTGTELAFIGHYLALGQDASVRAAIDVFKGASPSLHGDPAFVHASAGEPADRVLDAYASAAGVRRVLEGRGGPLGAIGVLLDQPALEGVTLSLSPSSGGARVRVHTALDPSLVRLSGPPHAPFTPTLQGAVPSGSMLLLDVSQLDRVAPRVLNAGTSAGIAGQVGPLLRRLGGALAAEGVNVHSLLSIFGGETAVAITSAAPATGSRPQAPSLIVVARTRNAARTRTALAALQVPLAQLFPAPASGPGQAPEFNDIQIGRVAAHQLALTPGLQLDYAVFDGLVVVSTSREGIAQVAEHGASIGGRQEFQAVLADRPRRVSSLLFLDFSQLLNLGEQTGLTHGARFQVLLPDLEKIRAVGMDSSSGEADTTAELFFQIP